MKSSRTTKQKHKEPLAIRKGDLAVDKHGNVFKRMDGETFLLVHDENNAYAFDRMYSFEQIYLHLSLFKGKVTIQNS